MFHVEHFPRGPLTALLHFLADGSDVLQDLVVKPPRLIESTAEIVQRYFVLIFRVVHPGLAQVGEIVEAQALTEARTVEKEMWHCAVRSRVFMLSISL